MADLTIHFNEIKPHFDNILNNCAPTGDNACLHKEIQGMSVADMTQVMAQYMDYARGKGAEKHLPGLDADKFFQGLESMKSLSGQGDPTMYQFEKKR